MHQRAMEGTQAGGTSGPSPAETPVPPPKEALLPPVATPCRSVSAVPDSVASPTTVSPESLPTPLSEKPPLLGDENAEKPVAGQIRLSQNAINLRMHRMMKTDSKGNSKVSAEIRKQYTNKKGKLRLQQIFQTCLYDPDWCVENPKQFVNLSMQYYVFVPIIAWNKK